MLVPFLLTLSPLGVLGLAMPPPPPPAVAPQATSVELVEPRNAPPTIEVMTMTCLMPGEEEETTTSSSSSSSTTDWSTWSPTWWTSSSSTSSSTIDDCWYWGDCSSSSTSSYTTSSLDWCALYGWDCSTTTTPTPNPTPMGTIGPASPPSSLSFACDDWDPYCSSDDTIPTPMAASVEPAAATPTTSSKNHHHAPIPPMIGAPARRGGGGGPGRPLFPPIGDRIRAVRAVEVTAATTETVVVGVDPDGTPLFTSTEWGSSSSSSSTLQTSVITPAPQFVSSATSPDGSSSPSSSLRCDDTFCSEGNSWCVYWAGITSWDASRGPVPGEKATIVGTCS